MSTQHEENVTHCKTPPEHAFSCLASSRYIGSSLVMCLIRAAGVCSIDPASLPPSRKHGVSVCKWERVCECTHVLWFLHDGRRWDGTTLMWISTSQLYLIIYSTALAIFVSSLRNSYESTRNHVEAITLICTCRHKHALWLAYIFPL